MFALHAGDYIAIAGILAVLTVAVVGGSLSMIRSFTKRVSALEVTINNGLKTKTDHIEETVDEIRTYLAWDGSTERRRHE